MKIKKYHKMVYIIILCVIMSNLLMGCVQKKKEEPKKDQGIEAEEPTVSEKEEEKGKTEQESSENGDIEPSGEFLGTDYSKVDFIILTLDEISVYYDLLQDYQMRFAINLAEAFTQSVNMISLIEEEELTAINEQGHVEGKQGHYYLELQFMSVQKITLGGEYFDCDDILMDLTDRVIYVRLEGEEVGILGYEEEALQSIFTQVENIIESISQNTLPDEN